jgi:putative ABC transport system permease protein
LLAALGASAAGGFVAERVLDVPYQFDPWVFLTGIVGGALLVGASGWLATRSVVTQPPLITLRAG